MDFLDIPGLNIAQKSGGKGWNPANGVPFCARAYICRPRPLGPLGAILKEGSMSDALSTIRCGRAAPSQPMRSEKRHPFGRLPNQHLQYAPAPRGPRPPSGAKSSCFRRARGEKVFFGLLSASSERRCCSEQTSCSGCRDRLVAATEMRRDHEPRQVRQVVGRIGTRLSAAHFVHADRSYQTLEAKIRLRQAAGLFRSPLLFLAQGAPKQSPRTNQRR